MKFEEKEKPYQIISRSLEGHKSLYQEVNSWVRPLLEEFGETEWGKRGCIVELRTAEPPKTEEREGWIVRRLGSTYHYRVEIVSFKKAEETKLGFFIETGGEVVLSEDLTKELLRKALDKAIRFGPTHLEP